jgi:hypothetical protein
MYGEYHIGEMGQIYKRFPYFDISYQDNRSVYGVGDPNPRDRSFNWDQEWRTNDMINFCVGTRD